MRSSYVVLLAAISHVAAQSDPPTNDGPVATLLPVVPDHIDVHDIRHITPQPIGGGAPMHYEHEDESSGAGIAAVAMPSWSSPSIVLDHVGHIDDVRIDSRGDMVITLNDRDAFDYCESNWPYGDIIFISYTPNCGDFHLGQRCYYHAQRLSFDWVFLQVTAIGWAKSIEDVTHNVTVNWGSYGDPSIGYGNPGSPGNTGDSAPQPKPPGTETADAQSTTFYSAAPTPVGTGCAAPRDTKYGLHTACLGPSFDDDLDSALGYFESSSFSFSQTLDYVDFGDTSNSSTVTKRNAVFDSVGKGFKSIADSTKNGIVALDKQVDTAAKSAFANFTDLVTKGQAITSGAIKQVPGLSGSPTPFDLKAITFSLPLPPSQCKSGGGTVNEACKPQTGAKGVKSPWNHDDVLIKSFSTVPKSKTKAAKGRGSKQKAKVNENNFVNLYCVKCGLRGSLRTKGSLTSDITKGITDGYINTMVDLTVDLGLGIYAQAYLEESFKANLYNIPLSPFTLGFITVGPYISIGAEFRFTLDMTGSALARGEAKFVGSEFNFKFGSTSNDAIRAYNFKPQFTPHFEAEGSVEATARFGIPVGVKLGISTLKGCKNCEGSIGIETTPSIRAGATIQGEANFNSDVKRIDSRLVPIAGCSGISTTVDVRNDLQFVLKGFGIGEYARPLQGTDDYLIRSACIELQKGKRNREPRDDERSLSLAVRDKNEHRRDDTDGSTTSNTTDSNSTTYVDLTKYVVEELDYVGYDGPSLPTIPYDLDEASFDGYWFSTLALQGTKDYVLAACNDGNLYLQKPTTENELPIETACNTLWAGYQDTVLSTPTGGVAYYYNNTMEKLGVSRLRSADTDKLPGSAVYVSLTTHQYDHASSLLVAVDAGYSVFFPAICTYSDGLGGRVYLINQDVSAGLAMLKSSDLTYSVTNGRVKDCYLLYLEITPRVVGEWADASGNISAVYESDPLDVEFDDEMFGADGELDFPKNELVTQTDDLDFSRTFSGPIN